MTRRAVAIALAVVLTLEMASTVARADVVTQGTSSAHSPSEPTWTFQGVVATDAVKMKHVAVVYDPLGLAGVPGSPPFMMWWSPGGTPAYAKTSTNGTVWSSSSLLSVVYPSTQVPLYHPEVIYDRQGFEEKRSSGNVYFKMWFYDGGTEDYNWIRYAESADGLAWRVYEDSPDASSGGKNYLEFSGGSGNEMSVLYRRGGTGVLVNGTDQQYVGYQSTGVVGMSADGVWFATASGQGGGPTDVCREILIAAPGDSARYRAWDDFPGAGSLTSWESETGLAWSSTQPGDVPIVGASWSDFYGGMSVITVGDEYWMYDTMAADNYSVGVLTAPLPMQVAIPEPRSMILMALGGLGLLIAAVRARRHHGAIVADW